MTIITNNVYETVYLVSQNTQIATTHEEPSGRNSDVLSTATTTAPQPSQE